MGRTLYSGSSTTSERYRSLVTWFQDSLKYFFLDDTSIKVSSDQGIDEVKA